MVKIFNGKYLIISILSVLESRLKYLRKCPRSGNKIKTYKYLIVSIFNFKAS